MQNTCFFSCIQQVVFCIAQVLCLQTISLLPVPRLLIMKDMVRRLQELRHTEQVQRAYALNCGEGATVSYEIQIRVLREFGLADAAAELLQVGNSTKPFKIGSLVLDCQLLLTMKILWYSFGFCDVVLYVIFLNLQFVISNLNKYSIFYT